MPNSMHWYPKDPSLPIPKRVQCDRLLETHQLANNIILPGTRNISILINPLIGGDMVLAR